jgi:quercetin dioxygenase-like cupin family protein
MEQNSFATAFHCHGTQGGNHMKGRLLLVSATLLPLFVSVGWAWAPAAQRPAGDAATAAVGVPGECVVPVAQRPQEMGCYLITETTIGPLRGNSAYWHIFRYAGPVDAEAAKVARDTVVQSLGQIWLLRISVNSRETATGGTLASSIGPLPLTNAPSYTARYMETVSSPGMRTAVHRHSGPEAWFLLSGVQCAATDQGSTKVVAGQGAFVPANLMMQLDTIGSTKRQALVLVLHDSRLPWTTMMRDAANLPANCAG